MSFDCSRFSFHPWQDFFGVVMQQGRVQLDSDWNEWVAQVARRLQAGTSDTLGRAVVPRGTPDGFRILATDGELTIGPGRMYVDGLLAENHGAPPLRWNTALAELAGTAELPLIAQPYLPYNPVNLDPHDAGAIFNRDLFAEGPHLVYLDVWQREYTYLQHPDPAEKADETTGQQRPALIDKAVGIDTTARLQTVWQVKVLPEIGESITCTTPDTDVPDWNELIRPSAARLSNATGGLTEAPDICRTPPAAGYKGLENQLYRVEIHRGGELDTATFKWSRDNATVATRVSAIHGDKRLVVEILARDEVWGLRSGDWIEILDDWHELHGQPGPLRRIVADNGVNAATRTILLEDALPPGLFPVDADGSTEPARHIRVRRWDQSGTVRHADGTVHHAIEDSASSDGIPVSATGIQLSLEHGILVEFSVDPAGGTFHSGDYWTFAARAADGSIEPLRQAPPRGTHHHYARLAIVTLPEVATDCRVLWPPTAGGSGCDCSICVDAEAHNAGSATLQQAIAELGERGGTICLGAGSYRLGEPLELNGVRSLRLRGQGWNTLLQADGVGPLLIIRDGRGVTIENMALIGATAEPTTALLAVDRCADLTLERLAVVAAASGDEPPIAVGLSGLLLNATIRDCTLVAGQGVAALGERDEGDYLFAANLRVIDSVLLCSEHGVNLAERSLYHGALSLRGNWLLGSRSAAIVVSGGALPASSIGIAENMIRTVGAGIRIGANGVRVTDNDIVGTVGGDDDGVDRESPADGIVLIPGLDLRVIADVLIAGNRLRALRGNGIAIRQRLGRAIVRANTVDGMTRAGLVMEDDAGAAHLCISDNHFTNLGAGFDSRKEHYSGMRLLDATRGDVSGNVFAGVAREAQRSPLRVALLAQACGELRIAGNRLFDIGPPTFTGATVAIAVDAGGRQLALDDNTVTRVDAVSDDLEISRWRAIAVGSLPKLKLTKSGTAPTGVVILPYQTQWLWLSEFRIGQSPSPYSVSLRGNRVRGQAIDAVLIEVRDTLACRLADNDAEISDAPDSGFAVARITCGDGGHANASNNRLINLGNTPCLELSVTAGKFAVLGNTTSAGGIEVNEHPLPDPWDKINITL